MTSLAETPWPELVASLGADPVAWTDAFMENRLKGQTKRDERDSMLIWFTAAIEAGKRA